MADPERAGAVSQRLGEMGLELAVDDFGTGYSSLALLRRLPVDAIKIDRSFVMGMASSHSDAVIVRSTVDLARNLGLQAVAEGVDTVAAWRELQALGCDLAQGHLFGEAMEAGEVVAWIERREASACGPQSRAHARCTAQPPPPRSEVGRDERLRGPAPHPPAPGAGRRGGARRRPRRSRAGRRLLPAARHDQHDGLVDDAGRGRRGDVPRRPGDPADGAGHDAELRQRAVQRPAHARRHPRAAHPPADRERRLDAAVDLRPGRLEPHRRPLDHVRRQRAVVDEHLPGQRAPRLVRVRRPGRADADPARRPAHARDPQRLGRQHARSSATPPTSRSSPTCRPSCRRSTRRRRRRARAATRRGRSRRPTRWSPSSASSPRARRSSPTGPRAPAPSRWTSACRRTRPTRSRSARSTTGATAASPSRATTRSTRPRPSRRRSPPRPSTPGTTATPSWSFTAELGAATDCRVMRGRDAIVSNWAPCGVAGDASTSRPRPTASSPSTCAPPTRRATPGRRRAARTRWTARCRPRRRSPRRRSRRATNRAPSWSFNGGGTPTPPSYECRLDPRRDDRLRLGDVRVAEVLRPVARAPTGPTSSRSAAAAPPGRSGATASHTYVLDTTAPVGARASRARPPRPGNDPTPTWAFTAEPGVDDRVPRHPRRDGGLRLGVRARARTRPTSAAGPTASTASPCARPTPPGNVGAVATNDYDMDLTPPAAPNDPELAEHAGHRRRPRRGSSTRRAAPRPSAGCPGRAATSPTGPPARRRRRTTSARSSTAPTRFSVRATDAVGNTGPAATQHYDLDRSVPGQPTITSAPASPSSNRNPDVELQRRRRRLQGVPPPARRDGRLRLGHLHVAQDATTSRVAARRRLHVLRARQEPGADARARGAGHLRAGHDRARRRRRSPPTPVARRATTRRRPGRFTAEAGAATQCRLTRGATIISDWAACTSPITLRPLRRSPTATYRISVRAIDAAGNVGAAGDARLPARHGGARGAGHHRHARRAPAPTPRRRGRSPPRPAPRSSAALTGPAGLVSDWAACTSPATLRRQRRARRRLRPRRPRDGPRRQHRAGDDHAPTRWTARVPAAPAITAAPASPGSGRDAVVVVHRQRAVARVPLQPGRDDHLRLGAVRLAAVLRPVAARPTRAYTFDVRGPTARPGTLGPVDDAHVRARHGRARWRPSSAAARSTPGTDADADLDLHRRARRRDRVPRHRAQRPRLRTGRRARSPFTPDLTAEPDGAFTVRRPRDATPPATSAPVAPRATRSTASCRPPRSITSAPADAGLRPQPAWSFTGDPGVALECRLDRGATTSSGWATCTSPDAVRPDAASPTATYTFSVRGYRHRRHHAAPRRPATTRSTPLAPAAPTFDSVPPSPGNTVHADLGLHRSSPARRPSAASTRRRTASSPTGRACTSPFTPDLTAEPDGTFTVDVRVTDAGRQRRPRCRPARTTWTATCRCSPSITRRPRPRRRPLADLGASTASPACSSTAASTRARPRSTAGPRARRRAPTTCRCAADATYTFTVRARNAAGTVSTAAAIDYELDTHGAGRPDVHVDAARRQLRPDPGLGLLGRAGRAGRLPHVRPAAASSPTGRRARARRPTTSRRVRRHVHLRRARDATPPATSAPAQTGTYELDRSVPSAPAITSAPRDAGHEPHADVVVHRRRRRDVRVPPGPGRDDRLQLDGLRLAALLRPVAGRPTAPTTSASARATPPATASPVTTSTLRARHHRARRPGDHAAARRPSATTRRRPGPSPPSPAPRPSAASPARAAAPSSAGRRARAPRRST